MHQGKVRKINNSPYILHPLEVAQILSGMTDDVEIIAAGVLHDIVEDTDGTLGEIEKALRQKSSRTCRFRNRRRIRGRRQGCDMEKAQGREP